MGPAHNSDSYSRASIERTQRNTKYRATPTRTWGSPGPGCRGHHVTSGW